jgi:hypothetical protein
VEQTASAPKFAPDEDGVYHFVTRIAKAYSGGAARGPELR